MKLSKSKLALAKVINENGGLVDGANFSSQDCDGWVYHFTTKPTIDSGSEVWKHKGCIGKGHFKAGKIKNWHQTILSREEYYQAYPMTDDDGWIEWKGGECPVGDDSLVDVRFPDGSEYFNTDADWDWSNTSDTPISHYRPSKKEVKPEFCESVMRSIPEPEEKPTIDQLAHDYRNKLDFANSKQQEADDAKAAADAALGELERAGEALGLLIGIAKADREPELVITNWRDLNVGDLVEVVSSLSGNREGEVGTVTRFDEFDKGCEVRVHFNDDPCDYEWCVDWKFIRRP